MSHQEQTSPQTPEVSTRLRALDGLRGFACLLVLLFHYVSYPLWPRSGSIEWYTKQVFSLGWCGVDLFFVLSGFLLGGVCLDQQRAPRYFRTFYARRFFRIVPVYLIFILVGYVLLEIVFYLPQYGWLQRPETPMWPFLLYLQNFYMVYQDKLGPNWLSGTWSLAVEEHFYLILPLVVKRYSLKGRFHLVLLGLVVSPLLLRWLLWAVLENDGLANYVISMCRWDSLFLGVLGAWMVRQPTLDAMLRRKRRWLWVMLLLLPFLISMLGRPGMERYEESLRVFMYSVIGLFFLALLLLTRYSAHIKKFFEAGWLVSLGAISYSVYLIHPLVFGLVSTAIVGRRPFFSSLSQLWVSGVCLVVTLVVGWVSYYFVERPVQARGRRWRY